MFLKLIESLFMLCSGGGVKCAKFEVPQFLVYCLFFRFNSPEEKNHSIVIGKFLPYGGFFGDQHRMLNNGKTI